MPEHAIIANGTPVIFTGSITMGETQFTQRALADRSREAKQALGIYEVERIGTAPEGERIVSWSYALEDGVVVGTPSAFAPIPAPASEPTAADAIREFRSAAPDPTAGPVQGKSYLVEDRVTIDGTLYEFTQALRWDDLNWTPMSLYQFLKPVPPDEGRIIWEQRFPPNLYGEEYVGREFEYEGQVYKLLQPDDTGHPPPLRGLPIWEHVGPI